MAKMKKNKGSFMILGWMLKKLNLKKYELLIYALIYSFSRKRNTAFYGSITYISDRLHISRSSVIRTLGSLVKKGYLIKHSYTKNGVKHASYRHSPDILSLNKIDVQTDNDVVCDDKFIIIYDWMVQNFMLAGNALMAYALIYSFTSGVNCHYEGTIEYICKRLNMSRATAKRVIQFLLKNHYIEQITQYSNRTKVAIYRSNTIDDFDEMISEMYEENTDEMVEKASFASVIKKRVENYREKKHFLAPENDKSNADLSPEDRKIAFCLGVKIFSEIKNFFQKNIEFGNFQDFVNRVLCDYSADFALI